MEDLTIYKRLDLLEKSVDEIIKLAHNISQELKKAQKEIEELELRVMEDDCR